VLSRYFSFQVSFSDGGGDSGEICSSTFSSIITNVNNEEKNKSVILLGCYI